MGYSASIIVSRLPVLAVLVIGMVLLYTRRTSHSRRAVKLGLAGLAVLLVGTLASALGELYGTDPVRFGPWVSTGQVVAAAIRMSGLGYLVGLSLVIAALVSSVGTVAAPSVRTSAVSSDAER